MTVCSGSPGSGPVAHNDKTRHTITVFVVLIAASVLLLSNLGGQYLWQDEAQTALIAGTIIDHGIPLGHDGRNSFSQDAGEDYGKNYIWLWHPWLSFYVLAGFFALFGQSTLVARLPFALFGVATAVLVYHFGTSLWQSRKAGLFSAAVLVLNVPFLELSRQCRYYSPGMFFALLALYGYWGMTRGRKRASVTFAIAAVLLFHTHYVHYAAMLAAVIVHAILFHRDKLKPLLLASAITVAANLPWLVWFSAMGSVVGAYSDIAARAAHFVITYLVQTGRHIFPPLLLVVAVTVWAIGRAKRIPTDNRDPEMVEKTAMLLLFAGATVFAVALTSTFPFFRFIAPVIPVMCLLSGRILCSATSLHRTLGAAAAIAVLVVLGSLWRMPDYYYEITHRYVGPVDGIVEYLKEHAKPDDVVAITYDDLPVKFYTGLRVVGGLTDENLTPAKTADWIILRKYIISSKDRAVHEYIRSHVRISDYEAIRLNYPDIAYHNREDPDERRYRTATGSPVVILRKRTETR